MVNCCEPLLAKRYYAQRYSAAASLAPRYRLVESTLKIDGVMVDSISTLGDVYRAGFLPNHIISSWASVALKSWEHLSPANCNGNEQGPYHAFWDSLHGHDEYTPRRDCPVGSKEMYAAVEGKSWDDNPLNKEWYGPGRYVSDKFRFREVSGGRRFFTTSHGRLGMAPVNASQGDEVCILYGAPIPFLLRKYEEGGHVLIGEACTSNTSCTKLSIDSDRSTSDVYGLMKGEAVVAEDEEGKSYRRQHDGSSSKTRQFVIH